MSEFDATRLTEWIIRKGPAVADLGEFVEGLCDHIVRAGLPIYRMTTAVPILHPLMRAESVLWVKGEGTNLRRFGTGGESQQAYLNSPLRVVYTTGKTVRFQITPTPFPGEFALAEELREDGATDYLALPIIFSDGSIKSVTFATKADSGFTDQMLLFLEHIRSAISVVLEIHTQRRTASVLLDTYVGSRTGHRVMAGEIRRGDGQSIDAVVFFSDLRDFTELSGSFSNRELVDILNFYFESITEPVEDEGGEVLKFIGDAVLAIFPYGSEAESWVAADRAMDAARAAIARLDEFSNTPFADRLEKLSVGVSLHAGSVFYGNVGSRSRLDFTVIGEAVNIGSRLNGLCREMRCPIIVSDTFAALSSREFDEIGVFDLKGVKAPQTALRPAA